MEGAAERGGGRLVTADFAASETPFWTATEPKDLTPSAGFTAGADAGEEEIGAAASSIEPKVTADPGQDTEFGWGLRKRINGNTLLHCTSGNVNTIFYGDSLTESARTTGMSCMEICRICDGNGGRWGRRL